MTVTFKPQLTGAKPVISLMDDIVTEQVLEAQYQNLFKAPVKQVYPPSQWWVTRVFHTTSKKPPIKWEPANYCCNDTLQDTADDFVKWSSCLGKKSDLTGYKISTMRLDMLNGTGELVKEFCLEHFQPKEKIFINGPKKKPFPA